MRKLNHINVQNFKSIRNLDLDLKPLNVFIGANGVGKSNFIGVFKFLNQIVEANLQAYIGACGGAERILYFGRKTSESLSLELSFDESVNGYQCVLKPTAEDSLILDSEQVWFHDKSRYPQQPYRENIGAGHPETRLERAASSSHVAGYVLSDLKSWQLYHFHDTSDSARVKQTSDIEDNRILQPDARNLSAFLYRLQKKHPDYFENIQDAVRMVAPFFDRFNLQPSRLNEDKIRLEWKEKGTDTYFNGSSISDGTLRFICLATLLLQPTLPSAILLDEPELGLHPYAITVLAGMLKQAATKTQVMVATQSVTLVNQFEIADIIVVERQDGQNVFRHLKTEDMAKWLDDYGLGDLWEKNVLGGRP
ncbi:MAG: AAA family ATPase [Lentisphaerae bacterium]|nr:AAA family ATPase [Lentisphaerota bacterium]